MEQRQPDVVPEHVWTVLQRPQRIDPSTEDACRALNAAAADLELDVRSLLPVVTPPGGVAVVGGTGWNACVYVIPAAAIFALLDSLEDSTTDAAAWDGEVFLARLLALVY